MDLFNLMQCNFPKTIDKSSLIFSSLIANKNNTAAIQKQISDMLSYISEWVSNPDVYNQHNVMLDKTITFFSFLERFVNESEESIKNRFKAIFIRNHDEKWGTPYDVKNVFRQYFPHATIYLVENVNKIDSVVSGELNYIVDGDIDTSTPSPSVWQRINCTVEKEASFSKAYGFQMNQSGGILTQTVEDLPNRKQINETEPYEYKNLTYFLHFFLKGKIDVQISKVDSGTTKYWDNTSKEWKTSAVNNRFEQTDWNNCSLYFITEGDDDTKNITFTFSYVDALTYLDYFRLFQKQPYSSFSIIAQFEGFSAANAFGLASGDADPNIETESANPPQPRYSNYGYYDKSFLSGLPVGYANDIYEDLLDYLRSQGVKAFLEIVIKDVA